MTRFDSKIRVSTRKASLLFEPASCVAKQISQYADREWKPYGLFFAEIDFSCTVEQIFLRKQKLETLDIRDTATAEKICIKVYLQEHSA